MEQLTIEQRKIVEEMSRKTTDFLKSLAEEYDVNIRTEYDSTNNVVIYQNSKWIGSLYLDVG